MNILLTNDDGLHAPGLVAAYEALAGLGDVTVVAPRVERSACGHAITHRGSITVEKKIHSRFGSAFAVDGTPADCVRVAMAGLVKHTFDFVFSGINNGANTGIDTYYSGTIAAAREAAVMGLRSYAFSQAIRSGVDTDWVATAQAAGFVLRDLLNESLPGLGFWSVNLPAPIAVNPRSEVHRVPVARCAAPAQFKVAKREGGRFIDFQNGAPYWTREVTGPNDYTVVRDGGIAITTIPLFADF